MKDRTLLYVVLIVCLFFISKWTFQGAYFLKDLVINTIPLENLYGNIQRSGQSPLWAPELAGGYPLLASGQIGFWYPPHMILRQFLPGVWTLNISLLLHALLAASGVFLFLKHNKTQSIAAGTGAILFPFGTAFVGKYSSLNLILPFMWVPMLLLFLQLFLERGKIKYLTLWIGAMALCILVGHPQMALYVLILQVLFVLCVTALSWNYWKRALAVGLGTVLVLGLTAFYTVPIVSNLPDTDRATGTLHPNASGMFDYEFTPKAFLGLIIPHPFGHDQAYTGPTNESELACYIGPVALALAIIGLVAGRKKFPVLWHVSVVLLAVGLSLAIGGYSPLFTWLVAHGWNYFNAPSRFFLYADIGIVFLAAVGIDFFRNSFKPFLFLLTIIPVLLVSWFWHQGVPWKFTAEPSITHLLNAQHNFIRIYSGGVIAENAPDNDFGIKDWNPICNTCVYRQTFSSPFASMDGVAIKVSSVQQGNGKLSLALYTSSGEKIRESILKNTNLVDSDWNYFKFDRLNNITNQQFYFEITSDMPREQSPRLLIHTNPKQQYDPSGRLYNCLKKGCAAVKDYDAAFKISSSTQSVQYYDALAPYSSAGFGVGTMQWSGSLPLGNVKNYLQPLGTWGDPWEAGARAIINRFSATHILGLFPAYRYADSLEGVSLVGSVPEGDQFLRVYKNNEAFPRIQFVKNVKSLSDPIDQINTIKKLSATDQSAVVADIPSDSVFNIQGSTAEISKDSRTKIVIQTHQAHDGFLVLRDVLLKDWAATIDTNPVHIYRVDGIFRGILVPAGEHTVTFTYTPSWIPFVLWLTSISSILFLILAWFSVRKQL
ncbi:MAG TPA: hypothetical protein VLG69_03675 [Candidatus Andersenbacteria bacterium]|nr:hypothetical protein [Candidatus Andersenbacteria bacterium]